MMNDMTITYANILLIRIIILRGIIRTYVCTYVLHALCGVELGSIRTYVLVCTYVCMYVCIISYF